LGLKIRVFLGPQTSFEGYQFEGTASALTDSFGYKISSRFEAINCPTHTELLAWSGADWVGSLTGFKPNLDRT
jgi:hypothetical protein